MQVWAFLKWWYVDGWLGELTRQAKRLDTIENYFSFDELAATLFSPFKQIDAGRSRGNIEAQFRSWLDRTVSRVVGAIARTTLLLVGGLWWLLSALVGACWLALWPFLPVAPLVGLAFTVLRGRSVVMKKLFDYYSLRARQARLHVLLSGWARWLFVSCSVVFATIGIWDIVTYSTIGWVYLGLSLFLLVPLIWDDRHLKLLPALSGNRLDDRLEPDVLARLPYEINLNAVVEALSYARSVHFMMVRSGVSPRFVSDQVGDDELKSAWDYAVSRKPKGIVRGSDLLAGLVASDDTLTSLLPHLQLEQHDIDLVADWYDHLQKLIDEHFEQKHTGGVARDWSFGYSRLLEQFGRNVSEQISGDDVDIVIETHLEAVNFMTDALSSQGRSNVVIVGAPGSGKTTIVEAFASKLLVSDKKTPASLKYRQVIQLDANSLIGAASGRGQLEQLVNTLLVEAYRAKNIILCLDDAELFLEEGVGSVDITKHPEAGSRRWCFENDFNYERTGLSKIVAA